MRETDDAEIQSLTAPKNYPVRLGIIGGGLAWSRICGLLVRA
jgi:hypothetical protein